MNYTEKELEERLDVLQQRDDILNHIASSPKNYNLHILNEFEGEHDIQEDDWFSDAGTVERVLREYFG